MWRARRLRSQGGAGGCRRGWRPFAISRSPNAPTTTARGGKGIARKDLERIFAEYSDFEGVRSLRVKLYGIASKQSSDVDQLWEGLAENEEEDDE